MKQLLVNDERILIEKDITAQNRETISKAVKEKLFHLKKLIEITVNPEHSIVNQIDIAINDKCHFYEDLIMEVLHINAKGIKSLAEELLVLDRDYKDIPRNVGKDEIDA